MKINKKYRSFLRENPTAQYGVTKFDKELKKELLRMIAVSNRSQIKDVLIVTAIMAPFSAGLGYALDKSSTPVWIGAVTGVTLVTASYIACYYFVENKKNKAKKALLIMKQLAELIPIFEDTLPPCIRFSAGKSAKCK